MGAAAVGGLTSLQTKSGTSFKVGQAFSRNFQGFVDELESLGYKIDSVGGYADQAAKKFVDDVGEEMSGGYDSTDTELDHEVTDNPGHIDDVTMKTAGGLNGPHKQYKKEYPGDNPLAENLSAKLMQEYQGIKVK
jgi:hypothetical protein